METDPRVEAAAKVLAGIEWDFKPEMRGHHLKWAQLALAAADAIDSRHTFGETITIPAGYLQEGEILRIVARSVLPESDFEAEERELVAHAEIMGLEAEVELLREERDALQAELDAESDDFDFVAKMPEPISRTRYVHENKVQKIEEERDHFCSVLQEYFDAIEATDIVEEVNGAHSLTITRRMADARSAARSALRGDKVVPPPPQNEDA